MQYKNHSHNQFDEGLVSALAGAAKAAGPMLTKAGAAVAKAGPKVAKAAGKIAAKTKGEYGRSTTAKVIQGTGNTVSRNARAAKVIALRKMGPEYRKAAASVWNNRGEIVKREITNPLKNTAQRYLRDPKRADEFANHTGFGKGLIRNMQSAAFPEKAPQPTTGSPTQQPQKPRMRVGSEGGLTPVAPAAAATTSPGEQSSTGAPRNDDATDPRIDTRAPKNDDATDPRPDTRAPRNDDKRAPGVIGRMARAALKSIQHNPENPGGRASGVKAFVKGIVSGMGARSPGSMKDIFAPGTYGDARPRSGNDFSRIANAKQTAEILALQQTTGMDQLQATAAILSKYQGRIDDDESRGNRAPRSGS